VKSIHRK